MTVAGRIKSPTKLTFSCVFILKFALHMFRTDTPFIVSSLRITVHAAVCTYHADCDKLLGLVSSNSEIGKCDSCWTLYANNYDARSVQYQIP